MYEINEAIIIILLLFIFQVNISESEIKVFPRTYAWRIFVYDSYSITNSRYFKTIVGDVSY